MKNIAIVSELRAGTRSREINDTPLVDLKTTLVNKVTAGIKKIQATLEKNSLRHISVKSVISYDIPSFEAGNSRQISDINFAYQMWFSNRKNS